RRGSFGREPAGDGGRKKTHAVTIRPRALASAVRRSVASRAKRVSRRDPPSVGADPLSSKGGTRTSKKRAVAAARGRPHSKRGSKVNRERLDMGDTLQSGPGPRGQGQRRCAGHSSAP